MSALTLTTTSQRIRVDLLAAHTTNPLRCVATWADETSTAHTVGSSLNNTNGTTEVEVVPAPAASTARIVKYLSVFNSDTVNHTVTIEAFDGTTRFTLYSATIAPNEKVEFGAQGFRTLSATGAEKTIQSGTAVAVSSGWSLAVQSADTTNNNAVANTIQTIGNGLSFAAASGQRYAFRAFIRYTAAATTTGSRWSVFSSVAATLLRYRSRYSLTTTSETLNTGLAAYDLPAASNASSAATTGNLAVIEGFITLSAAGTVDFRFASEIASSAIVAQAGSFVEYIAI